MYVQVYVNLCVSVSLRVRGVVTKLWSYSFRFCLVWGPTLGTFEICWNIMWPWSICLVRSDLSIKIRFFAILSFKKVMVISKLRHWTGILKVGKGFPMTPNKTPNVSYLGVQKIKLSYDKTALCSFSNQKLQFRSCS